MAYRAVSVRPTDRWLVGSGDKPDPALHTLYKLFDTTNNSEWKSSGIAWINTAIQGAANMHDSHVHHVPVNTFFHLHTGITTTIAWDIEPGSRVITVANPTGFLVGDEIQLTRAVGDWRESTHPVITDVTGDVLTLDRPLDSAWVIGDLVEVVIEDMAGTGTLYSPLSYKMYPPRGSIMHVQSFVLNITMSTTGDDSLFGNLAELTNGVILRAYNGEHDIYGTFTDWKTNGDIRMDMGDIQYHDKAGGGFHSVAGDGEIGSRTGAVPELIAANGDHLEILIQDDLLALATFRLKAQGHIEGR